MRKSPPYSYFSEQFRSVAIVMGGLILLTSCSQVNPDISPAEDLPALEIDSTSKAFSSKSLPQLDVTITGQVSKFVMKLQYSADNGSSWQDLNSGLAQTLNFNQALCPANLCPFTFSVVDVGAKIPALAALPVNGEGKVLFRGIGQFGKTAPGEVTFRRIKGGFISVGSVNFTERGMASKTTSRFKVVGARFESDKVGTSPSFKAVGAFQ